jgi:hypothetical protein
MLPADASVNVTVSGAMPLVGVALKFAITPPGGATVI